jgi:hypothetical protein
LHSVQNWKQKVALLALRAAPFGQAVRTLVALSAAPTGVGWAKKFVYRRALFIGRSGIREV